MAAGTRIYVVFKSRSDIWLVLISHDDCCSREVSSDVHPGWAMADRSRSIPRDPDNSGKFVLEKYRPCRLGAPRSYLRYKCEGYVALLFKMFSTDGKFLSPGSHAAARTIETFGVLLRYCPYFELVQCVAWSVASLFVPSLLGE
jgi:hypothetical protein